MSSTDEYEHPLPRFDIVHSISQGTERTFSPLPVLHHHQAVDIGRELGHDYHQARSLGVVSSGVELVNCKQRALGWTRWMLD